MEEEKVGKRTENKMNTINKQINTIFQKKNIKLGGTHR